VEGDDLGREKGLLRTNSRKCVSNVMSSALSWLYHNMLSGTVMYCLSKYQVATSGVPHIVTKFYRNIMQLRSLENNNFKFPSIGDGIFADTQTEKVIPKPEPIIKCQSTGQPDETH
jgi:hypothetical protein